MTNSWLSRTSIKYYASEILASLVALVASAGSAWLLDRVTASNGLISAGSAIAGTAGFIIGMAAIYAVLHIRRYYIGQRCFAADMKSILKANLRGIAAMYAVRIPFQWVVQAHWLSPPVAATVAQALSGAIATAVRAYYNYRANIFGTAEPRA
ncbi:MAG TPA: hypothetical protein ENN81_10825 [Phycisphaerales bacterium]|nr:hypothetical protein [Phycisphaerales bacterium]